MRFLALVLANLRRKKVRTALTVGSFLVALFLFGLLVAIHGAFYQGVEVAGIDRLMVINKVTLTQPLPLSYREHLLRTKGVKAVTFAWWFGGTYKDERNFFPQFAIDADTYRDMFPEQQVTDAEWRAFRADRQGCIVGEGTANRFGWKVGDRVPLIGTIFRGRWEFNIRGIYRARRPGDDTSQFWFRYDYLEERAAQWFKGTVGWYVVRVTHPDDAATVAKAIDAQFSNSPWETKTETERAFAAAFAKQMGNIELLILTIGSVVFFTLLLVSGNTMAIAVRERTRELAVLKTLGFSDRTVLALVLSESLLVAVLGGGCGLLLAKAMTAYNGPGLSQVASVLGGAFFIPAESLAAGAALTVAVGLVAGILPALSAMRLRVVDALRRV